MRVKEQSPENSKKNEYLLISIVIANYNHSKVLKGCLESIFRSYYPKYEVIVVDDNSSDDSVKIAKSFDCTVIELKKGLGQGFARNIGVDKSKGDIIFFIDSDTEIRPDALKIINENFSNEDIDAVIGIVDKVPVSGGWVSKYMCLETHYLGISSESRYSDYFIALVGAIKKDTFNNIGQFKHPWMDDFEFNNRLPDGTKIVLEKRLMIKHMYGGFITTFMKFFKRSVYWINLQKNKKIDNAFFSIRRVLGVGFSLATFCSIIFFSLLAFAINLPIIVLGVPTSFFILFIAVNLDFFRFIYAEKGIVFTIYSVILRFFFSLAIAIGSSIGKIRGIVKK